MGSLLLEQSGCLFCSWLLIYVIISRGVASSGKAAYITTFYPFTVIVIILIIACLQPGAKEGMLYFIKPQWGKMLDANVWAAAVGQCFFSLSVGFGPIINYASYNRFHHNIYNDALVVSFVDTFASFVAGLTVFATIGSIAHELNIDINSAMIGGPGLVFIAFSDAIGNITAFPYASHIVSVLFFTMLLTLASGSAVSLQMAAISVVCDKFPKFSKFWITAGMTAFGFIVSLIYVTSSGQFLVTLVDHYGGNVNIYALALLECVGISWVYGVRSFSKDIEFMLNRKLDRYWRVCWVGVIPTLLFVVMIYSTITGKPLKHNGKEYSALATAFGWTLTMSTLIPVPILAVYTLYNLKGSFSERLMTSLKSNKDFGPRNPIDKERWKLFKKNTTREEGPASHSGNTFAFSHGEQQSFSNFLTDFEDGTVLCKENGSMSFSEFEEIGSATGVTVNNNNATFKK